MLASVSMQRGFKALVVDKYVVHGPGGEGSDFNCSPHLAERVPGNLSWSHFYQVIRSAPQAQWRSVSHFVNWCQAVGGFHDRDQLRAYRQQAEGEGMISLARNGRHKRVIRKG